MLLNLHLNVIVKIFNDGTTHYTDITANLIRVCTEMLDWRSTRKGHVNDNLLETSERTSRSGQMINGVHCV